MPDSARAVLAALGMAAVSAAAAGGWTQVGPLQQHDTIVAADIDFSDATGQPIVAYGFDASAGDTSIVFRRWNESSRAWVTIASHTPQFGQPYDDFSFRERRGTLYLGLRIDESFVLSSILRGGEGYDGFDGCWAFPGWTWGFEVTDAGNARLVTSPDNATLQTSLYNHTGWDHYPATDAWAPFVNVTKPVLPPTLGKVAVARGANDTLAVAFEQAGGSAVALTTLTASRRFDVLASGIGGTHPAVAWAPDGGSGTGFVAVATLRGACVDVWLRSSTSPGRTLECALKHAALPVSVAISRAASGDAAVVIAAPSAVTPQTVATAYCALPACNGWAQLQIPAGGPVTNVAIDAPEWWEPAARASRDVHAVVTWGSAAPGSQDAVAVFALSL